ncbi:MAG: histidine phosphatase family protein [Planctomycetota bacterium]|nr:histidine phosphatase family protein [Planctomycetota bacterium]
MAKLYVIPTGRTTWEEQDRVESAAGAPLCEQGIQCVQDLAKELTPHNIRTVYVSSGEAERQTAKLLAKVLKIKMRPDRDLREIDYGLWQGLMLQEIKRRQPKLYHQWIESPASVRPPGGETLAEADRRLRQALSRIVKRQKEDAALLVLRPVALGLVRCALADEPINNLPQHMDRSFRWASYETDGDLL